MKSFSFNSILLKEKYNSILFKFFLNLIIGSAEESF